MPILEKLLATKQNQVELNRHNAIASPHSSTRQVTAASEATKELLAAQTSSITQTAPKTPAISHLLTGCHKDLYSCSEYVKY